LCRRFQITLLRVLIDHNLNNLNGLLDGDSSGDNIEIDYLLLPATGKDRTIIDWECIASVLFSCEKFSEYHWNCPLPNGYTQSVQTKDGCVCICMLLNSLVSTLKNHS
jgi:endoribonuclease Dicer